MYIHELPDWPQFDWNPERIAESLVAIRHQQGRLLGHMEALGFNLRQEATLQVLTEDVLKTSEIEGERLDAEEVRSSIARRLGIDIGALKPADRNVEGVVEMMLDATRLFAQPLTAERLFRWHTSLFQDPGICTKGHAGHYALATVVPGLPGTRYRRLTDRSQISPQ